MSAVFIRATAVAMLAMLAGGCEEPARAPSAASSGRAEMPLALANNAVAQAEAEGGTRFYSFMGLGAGKTWLDISRRAYEYDPVAERWLELPPVPVPEGRLAAVAATAGGQVYLFGGYTVAPDGHEVSTPEVLRFDPATRSYAPVAPMPTPVDDSVALVRNDRWIYLVSGWHMDRNLDLVQVYDTVADSWHEATPFPGTPVFGHAGAMLGDTLLVCDGVLLRVVEGKRSFAASNECWRGEVDAEDPGAIAWRRVASHPGGARYRMAAAADPDRGWLVFVGGSENPYNYNGIGYDGAPSPASARAQAYDPVEDRWLDLAPLPEPSMDHRGLLRHDGRYFLLGGMAEGQRVVARVLAYAPEPESPEAR